MNSTFLTLCSPPALTATASAQFTRWPEYKKYRGFSLLLEAINQFAVRYACAHYPCEATQRFLPAIVEDYLCNADLQDTRAFLEGEAESLHSGLRVHCRAWSDETRSRLLARATIGVHPVVLPACAGPAETGYFPGELWTVSARNQHNYHFRLNGCHPLFSEHFPGNAICPGSLLIDLILSLMPLAAADNYIRLHKVKFLSAVKPECDYCLTLSGEEVNQRARFVITSASGCRHVSGSYACSEERL